MAPALLRFATGDVNRCCTPYVPTGRHIQAPHFDNRSLESLTAVISGTLGSLQDSSIPYRSGSSLCGC